jgi:hypothetical protein
MRLTERAIYQLAGLSCEFARSPETMAVFIKFAKELHRRDVPNCNDPDCFLTYASEAMWAAALKETEVTLAIALRDLHDREMGGLN